MSNVICLSSNELVMNTFTTISNFMSSYFVPTPKTNLRKNPRTELILTQYYPFYLKLTARDKTQFWDRLEEVFAITKFNFQDEYDYDNFKYRLLVAAEVAHYVIGQRKVNLKLPVFEMDTLSSKHDYALGADLTEGRVVIHWEKFVEEISRGEETGLIVVLLDELYLSKIKKLDQVLKDTFLNVKSTSGERRSLFNIYDVVDKNTFYKACLRSYFLFPQELRNIHPRIFRQVDYLIYNNV